MNRPVQVAFMTGQSRPGRCALSTDQQAFLDALPVPAHARVRSNFPYAVDPGPPADAPLVVASWHNVRQYMESRRPAFAERHRPAVVRMLAQAERTIVLAGSCGLEILANLALSGQALRTVHVFAYGPVFRHRPACEIFAVRGRTDWVARLWGDGSGLVVEGHHLAYLRNPQVLALCQEFVARVAARAGGAP